MTRRICLGLDLADDPALIAEYEEWHRPGGPPAEVTRSIRDAGIVNMEIFRAGTRMFMVIDADETYSADAKARDDAANPAVVAWAQRMKRYQRPVPAAGPDGTWIEMTRIFSLADQPPTEEGAAA